MVSIIRPYKRVIIPTIEFSYSPLDSSSMCNFGGRGGGGGKGGDEKINYTSLVSTS